MYRIFIFIILLFNIIDTKSNDIDIQSKAKIYKDNLELNVLIFNKTKNDIFLPISDWIFEKFNNKFNSCNFLYFQSTYYNNYIMLLPEKINLNTVEDATVIDAVYNFQSEKLPDHLKILKGDSLIIKLIRPLNDLSIKILEKEKFKVYLRISYCFDYRIYQLEDILSCNIAELDITNKHFEYQFKIKSNNLDYNYKLPYFLNEDSYCKLDSFRNKIIKLVYDNYLTTECSLTVDY